MCKVAGEAHNKLIASGCLDVNSFKRAIHPDAQIIAYKYLI